MQAKPRFACYPCLPGLLTAVLPAGAQTVYEAAGLMTYEVAEADPPIRWARPFRVAVSNALWTVSVRLPEVDNIELVKQGNTESNIWLSMIIERPAPNSNKSVLKIEDTDVPASDVGTFAPICWMAYGSAEYLKLQSKALKPIWYVPDSYIRKEGLKLPAVWETNAALPGLPGSVAWFQNGLQSASSSTRRVLSQFPPPYDKGSTTATFVTLSWTNTGPYRIPQEFAFAKWAPKPGGVSSNDLLLQWTVKGQLTNFVIGTKETFDPLIPGVVEVVDARFVTMMPAAFYRATNLNSLPSTSDPRAVSAVESWVTPSPDLPGRETHRRSILY